ncbi:hypothetical protein A3860_19870 [Niastella vici]|uniref:Uncharacterized protein n=1 Tax=Niastella vici TaxID=1703345 RepID=A0A1V9G0Y8_9BACT|nr:hypothetical protein [Niastella vici]OQP64237.1 hypothetical protein A3860_19870 [Niastella vici]
MKTFLAEIIPQIQRFSARLDNLTLLMNQHWVLIDNIEHKKTVYIFRTNNQLLIANDGQVENAKWEYLGNNSLLIGNINGTYLFKHGFFDKNLLALKIDSRDEYAIFINENKYNGDLNSFEKVLDFIRTSYLKEKLSSLHTTTISQTKIYSSNKGELEIEQIGVNEFPSPGDKVFMNNRPAINGKYKLGFMWYIKVVNGEIEDISHI